MNNIYKDNNLMYGLLNPYVEMVDMGKYNTLILF